MLITGADVGASKIAKAEKLEVEVVDQARDLGAADRRRRDLNSPSRIMERVFQNAMRG